MPFGLRAKWSLAGLHLVLVALGAAQFSWERLGWPGAIFQYYGILSGAGSGYGFFAPGVGTGLRVEFDIVGKSGALTRDRFEVGMNRETNLRLGNILGPVSRNVDDEKLRRSVAASWAGKMFALHPDATQIIVRAETLDPPPMADYVSGSRSPWISLYRAKFVRRGR